MEPVIYILRGLPGSGKSTFAQELVNLFQSHDPIWVEADMWHVIDGTYQWKPERVRFAHEQCQSHVKKAMELKHPVIIVSNTFTQEWELKPYLDLANTHEYRIVSLVVENRHGSDNVHSVPQETIEKMRNRFELKL